MKNFLIIANRKKDINLILTDRIKKHLKRNGAVCQLSEEFDPSHPTKIEVPEGVDCIVVIGGDGTILGAASLLVGRNIPLLGINLGTLGFLAEVNLEELSEALDRLVVDDYQIEKRIMLKADVYQDGQPVANYVALNDFVVSRSGYSRIIGLNVSINGSIIESYRADGMICCTPTGSTGYNLSAGGPIINPTCKNFVITPICPHSLMSRSIVLAKEDKVTIEILHVRKTQEEEAIISYDGREGVRLKPGDYVEIYKSEEVTPFIKMKEVSFVQVLKDKLS